MSSSGFTAIPKSLYGNYGLDVNTWALFNALAHYANTDGFCFPSQSTLAHDLGRSRAWVNKYISKLVEIGLVEKEHRTRSSDNGNTSCGYIIPSIRDFHLSKNVTPPVMKNDINNENQINKKLHSNDPSSLDNEQDRWEPSNDAIEEAKSINPNLDTQSHVERFKLKIKAKGYKYKDLNSAWLLWIREDLTQESKSPKNKSASCSSRSPHSVMSAMENVLTRRGHYYAH